MKAGGWRVGRPGQGRPLYYSKESNFTLRMVVDMIRLMSENGASSCGRKNYSMGRGIQETGRWYRMVGSQALGRR